MIAVIDIGILKKINSILRLLFGREEFFLIKIKIPIFTSS